MCIVYKRAMYCLSLVCTSGNAINIFDVKVDVQIGDLRFRVKFHDECVRFIHMLSYAQSPR